MDLRPRFLMLVDILMFFLGFGLVFALAYAWADEARQPPADQIWEDRLDRSTPAVRDQSLTAAVQTALELDPELAPYPMAVTTRAAVVTLSGAVPTTQLRRRAEEAARKTPGVSGVENRLEVDPARKPARPRAGEGQARLP